MQTINLDSYVPISPVMKEEFRTLYTSLEFSGADHQTICVTSSYPNAGKSYIAYNLASVIAEDNNKVLLIDADMRNSVLYKQLGYEKEITGLSHVLLKKCSPTEALYGTTIPNLYLMPTGVFSNNPTTLLRKGIFRELLQRLCQVVDYVIVDTPPIQMVTDGTIIANACDGSILVVPAKEESRRSARNSIEMLQNANDNFLGVVLNKKEHERKGYGYGKYGYGYGYGYGEGGKKHAGK